jgi:hypothetical protein
MPKWRLWRGGPHSMYWETPSLFNDAIRRFLAATTSASAPPA